VWDVPDAVASLLPRVEVTLRGASAPDIAAQSPARVAQRLDQRSPGRRSLRVDPAKAP
jgi:hypothetical protein